MLYALLTEQGTAMPETALCSNHSSASYRRAMREIAQQEPDYAVNGPFTNVQGNSEVSCQVCGSDGVDHKFILEIRTDNVAFKDNPDELSALLRIVAGRVRNGTTKGTISDSNGNTVGNFRFS
jgi:hypothetical protein